MKRIQWKDQEKVFDLPKRFDTLEQDKIQGIREALRFAEQLGFSSNSSPVDILLQALIDLSLLLAKSFKDLDKIKRQRLTPSLEWDYDRSDSLGNPVSYKKKILPKPIGDPLSESFFIGLAAFGVRFRNGSLTTKSFADSFANFISTPKGAKTNNRKNKIAETKTKQSSLAYFRRRRYSTTKSRTTKS